MTAGPANEAGQGLTFVVTQNTNPGLFAAARPSRPTAPSPSPPPPMPSAAPRSPWCCGTAATPATAGTAPQTFTITVVQVPTARFGWSMPDRFGPDNLTTHYSSETGLTTLTGGPDGLIDYLAEDTSLAQAYINPGVWSVNFDASGSSGPVSPVVAYRWEIGGQTVSTQRAFTHPFPAQGVYPVTLTVTAADGQIGSVNAGYSRPRPLHRLARRLVRLRRRQPGSAAGV